MVTINLKGREIPLLYTTWEMKEIQEDIAPISRAISLVLGRNPDDKKDMSKYGSADHLMAAAKLIRILGNAGLEDAGEDANLTDKWILRALWPAQLIDAVKAIMTALQEGNRSEIPEKKQTGPVDVTLEEIKKNETKES